MAKILLCWELGSGLGHARRLAGLAKALIENGFQVSMATTAPEQAKASGFAHGPVIPIAQWPGVLASSSRTVVAATFGDLMAELLFVDESGIHERIRLWDQLFTTSGADLIVADYAPGAVLAARGMLPVVNIGDSYYLPPPELPSFPRLFEEPPRHDETIVVARINAALRAVARPELVSYPDVARAAATMVTNFPALDIYAAQRKLPAIGPLELMPEISAEKPTRLFGYFPSGTEFNPRIVNGLIASKIAGRIVIPGMQRNPVPNPFGAPTQFTAQLADMRSTFRGAAVYVSHGGAQSAAAALAAGVPQVIIAADDEKRLIGKRIARAGAGMTLRAEKLQSADLAQAINSVVNEPMYRRAALVLAQECQSLLKQQPTATLLSAVSALAKPGERN